jgi:hypothetical protein
LCSDNCKPPHRVGGDRTRAARLELLTLLPYFYYQQQHALAVSDLLKWASNNMLNKTINVKRLLKCEATYVMLTKVTRKHEAAANIKCQLRVATINEVRFIAMVIIQNDCIK